MGAEMTARTDLRATMPLIYEFVDAMSALGRENFKVTYAAENGRVIGKAPDRSGFVAWEFLRVEKRK